MLCNQCGSTQFEEENGLFYCCFCQTQSQGFTQESGQDFVDISRHLAKEVKAPKRVKREVKQRTGVLWTTTEAFNIILYEQLNTIFEINSEITNQKDMREVFQLIWFSYVRKAGLAFTKGEKEDNPLIRRRLHPASRFRDVQILTNKVDNCLPPFKNGSTELGFCDIFSLGTDGVIRTFRELEAFNEFEINRTEEQNNCELFDIFYERYRDPRKYTEKTSQSMKISKESRKQLKEILSKKSSNLSSEKFDDFDDEDMRIEDNVFRAEPLMGEDFRDSTKSKSSITSCDSLGTNSFGEDYDKELMKNMTEATKLYSEYIPLSFLKNSRNMDSNYFIDLMSLPKTLAFLNIVCRLLSYNIYCFDLIRWANEGHIPYNNCLKCLPDDWLLISNDFNTFTSNSVPSFKTISILSAKISNHIGIESFPRPDLKGLLFRFVKDLNLPFDLVNLISQEYDLFEHFNDQIDYMSKGVKERNKQKMPHFEKWALMSIVLVLKRIFILNDSSEKLLSRSVEDNKNSYFIWNEWENYTRLRVDLIRSYFIPSYIGDLEDIRDVDLISKHYFQMSETQPTLGLNKRALFRNSDFRIEAQKEFQEFMFEQPVGGQSSEPLKPSLYPLTNATNFVLKRINCSSFNQKMSISFEDRVITPWTCSHGKVFHRGYEFLVKDHNQWSKSFKLLIYLSCFILNCRVNTLIPILNCMEKKYFRKRND